MNDRIVYVRRGPESKWTKIAFSEIAINEDFILCESDGTPVGHYIAASGPYTNRYGVDEIRVLESIS